MKKTKIPIKYRILSGIMSGIIFATLMLLFDLWSDKTFSLSKFLLHSFFFGLLMGLFIRNKYAKE